MLPEVPREAAVLEVEKGRVFMKDGYTVTSFPPQTLVDQDLADRLEFRLSYPGSMSKTLALWVQLIH